MDDTNADAPLNGELTQRCCVHTQNMDWSPSPGGAVLRKRVHRVGPAESGQVTSLVQYPPDAQFHSHPHPEGEEILVLEGVFSDEHGDWPAGSYLLNPEGFSHSPFSRLGCTLFVKLRQYPGTSREQHQLRSQDIPWQEAEQSGREFKPLYTQAGFSDRSRLERWHAGAGPYSLSWPEGVEVLVISGAVIDEEDEYESGSWLRLPPGSQHTLRCTRDAELYIKEGGFAYLRTS